MKLNRTMMLCLCIVLAVAMATTGTIAYLQDSASDVNVMTMGNVKIEQIEQERDENGDLTDFTQGKPAMPAVGPIGWADEHLVVGDHEVKVFTEDLKNVIDKIVTVKNTGRSDAYIRTIIAIEAPNGDPNDLLHVNHNHVDYVQAPSWTLITLDGVEYVYACYTYKDILAPGEVSAPSLIQLFLDSKATNEDIEAFGEEWEVIVLSQAVQAAGFDDAATALNEAFGEANVQNVTEWMGGAKAESPYVDNQADLDEALKAGGEVILSAGEYTIPGNVETPVEIIGFGPDQTIIKIDGNVQNVVVKNATVTGGNDLNVKAGQTAVFENVVFDDKLGSTAQGVVKGDMTFIDCTFKGGFHIDQSTADTTVTFKGCTFADSAYIKLGGSAKYSLVDCVVETLASDATGPWGKQWLIAYNDIELTGCTLGRVIRAGGAITITLDGCVDANGEAVTAAIVHEYNSPNVVIK